MGRRTGAMLTAASFIFAGLVLLAIIAALLDPTSSMVAVLGTMAWTTIGPHLVLVAIIAVVLGLLGLRGKPRGSVSGAVVLLSFLAVAGSAIIVGRIMFAVAAAGGAVNPWQALLLESMTEPEPDLVETVATVDDTVLQAAIFRPNGGGERFPVLVYVHGGGFIAGTKTETAADLRWFADRGWLVVSIDYRLFMAGRPTWDKAPADAACGLAWAVENAARFSGDADRLVLMGDSAGGNLAINVGYAAAAGRALSSCGGSVPKPDAIAVQYPAVDPLSIYEDGFPIPDFEPEMLVSGYIGGSPDDDPERIAAIASATYLTPMAPPTMIIAPENDSLVVPHGVYRFAEKASAMGIDVTLVRIPFANHIYNQIAANSLGNQAGRTLRLRFVERQLLDMAE